MNYNSTENEPYKMTIGETYDIVRGYWGGRHCPVEIWYYDEYIMLPTGCIYQHCIALSYMTLN